jgi:hypothetical protein
MINKQFGEKKREEKGFDSGSTFVKLRSSPNISMNYMKIKNETEEVMSFQ